MTLAFSIPFRDLAPAVDEWRERTCEAKPSHGVPPHVTLLIPAPPDLETAVATLEPFGPFEVTFPRLDRFPGTLWLAPEPAEPFVRMTEALVAAFPEHPPYDGAFEEITPHLTVAQGDELGDAETALEPRLPFRSRASSVVLFEQVAPDRWRENAELPL
ncbi:MAG TPA: 2'-5' RNA ligase family protein [Gaiellaceae bacterium]|nr:2'-5' RNA ligase family protein [Gaiellaceae bacterium]